MKKSIKHEAPVTNGLAHFTASKVEKADEIKGGGDIIIIEDMSGD